MTIDEPEWMVPYIQRHEHHPFCKVFGLVDVKIEADAIAQEDRTLRDRFAGITLEKNLSYLMNERTGGLMSADEAFKRFKVCCENAYWLADEMMKSRKLKFRGENNGTP